MGLINGLFKKPIPETKPHILMSMVLFPGKDCFSFLWFAEDLKQQYGAELGSEGNDDVAAAFKIKDEQVYLMNMNFPVPSDDIEETAKYSYNWLNAAKDLEDHQGHIIISLTDHTPNPIKCFRIQTEMICSILRTTDAIGVYDGGQSLLIPKNDYLTESQTMSEDHLPLNLWLYFGLRTTKGKTNGYTYGMRAFGKPEMEILDSDKTLEEIYQMLWNIAHYVLLNNVSFVAGQTFGYTPNQKLDISYSKSRYAGGYSFKFAY